MVDNHTNEGTENDGPTGDGGGKGAINGDETDDFEGTGRRTFLKGVGVAAALGGGLFAGTASAASFTASPSGEVVVDPGEYSWDGGLEIGSGDALVGGGSAGDVVVNIESGTMDGSNEGRLENIVVRGENPESKAGIDLHPGSTVDGFIWPEGGQQTEDRAFYTPTGGNSPVTLRNAAWAWCVDNGAYVDKPPMRIENCAAVNNNISNIRVGHREGTDSGATTYVRNSLVAVTREVLSHEGNSSNGRGLRIRHPGTFVIENCWFVFLDVDTASNPIDIEEEASGSTVEIRNCAFYNDSDEAIISDAGSSDLTIENCTVVGSGSTEVDADYSGSGVTEGGSAEFPLPSAITGYAVADEIEGVGPGIGPWTESSGTVTQPTNTTEETETETPEETADPSEFEHTLVLHASPDNPGDVDFQVTVSGSAALGADAEEGADSVTQNGDGSSTIQVTDLAPDELDSFRFDGEVVSYELPDGYEVDVSLDGTATTLEELVSDETSTPEQTSTEDESTPTETPEQTPESTPTEDESTPSDGADDEKKKPGDRHKRGHHEDASGDGKKSGDGSADELPPHRLSLRGTDGDDVTRYTFTVTGDIVRDEEASTVTGDGTPWDRLEDIAIDGKVIGLVGSGVDAYRFGGTVSEITVDGDATVTIERDV